MRRPDNPSPLIYETGERDSNDEGGLTAGGIFNLIRDISDPEFPYTLEQVGSGHTTPYREIVPLLAPSSQVVLSAECRP